MSVRGEIAINGRGFAVSRDKFFEVFSNGTTTNWGTVSNDSLPVTMAASSMFVLIGSAGFAYTFNLQTSVFAQVNPAFFAGSVSRVGYSDGFFTVTIVNSRQIYASAVEDPTTWPGLSTELVSLFPGNIVSDIIDHREWWLFSSSSTVVYEDVGASPFPFAANPSAYIEQGCAAKFSTAKLDNTIFWLGQDDRGNGIVWRASGYTPQRVSNHAIELAFQSYSRIDDAIAYTFQDQGHSFYHLYFPTADKSWRYDTATNMWHRVGFWDDVIHDYHAHHSQCHMFVFGKHLVGDWASDFIYDMNISHVQDEFSGAGGGGGGGGETEQYAIRRLRRAPHISKEQKRIRHTQLQIFLESGLGPIPALTIPAPPVVTDDFNRANANPAGAPWVTLTGLNPIQIVSNTVRPTALFPALSSFAYYSGPIWPDNQYSKFTVMALSNFNFTSSSGLAAVVRYSPGTTSDQWYQGVVNASGQIAIQFITLDHATSTISGQVLATDTLAINPGDVIQLNAVESDDGSGVGLTLIVNGTEILGIGHTVGHITSGSPGVGLAAITTLADASLDNWESGGFAENRDPQIMLRWSNDSAHTWSNEHMLNAGQAGEFRTRVIQRRLGVARDRVYEVACSDPIAWRLVDAYLDVGPSSGT